MEYRIMGQGPVTVVVETGIGNSYYDWLPISEKLSEHYKVVLYHRKGYGNSAMPKSKRTTENIAEELKTLTDELALEKFILMGHSYGGLVAQTFAGMYSERVLGLLLIDSTSKDAYKLEQLDTPFLNTHCSMKVMAKMIASFALKTQEDLLEMHTDNINNKSYLSKEDRDLYIACVTNGPSNNVVAEEFEYLFESGKSIKASDVYKLVLRRDESVSVKNWIAGGVPEEEALAHEALWKTLQEAMGDDVIEAKGCDHMIYIENDVYVIEALERLVGKCV